MTTIDASTINLLDPRFYVDPFESYRWLRDNEPVFWDPIQRVWGISRYDDVVAVENNTKRYTSVFGSRPRIDQHSDTSMINRDDPEHQDQRRLVARQFTPRAVKQIEDRIRAVVTELIDAVIADGECEAIMDLASPLPAILIGEKLGYPHELWPQAARMVRDHDVRVGPEQRRRLRGAAIGAQRPGDHGVRDGDVGAGRPATRRAAERPHLHLGPHGRARRALDRRRDHLRGDAARSTAAPRPPAR